MCDKTHAGNEYLTLPLEQTFFSGDTEGIKMNFTKPPFHIRRKMKKLKFSPEEMLHPLAMTVNVGGIRQLNPISFCKRDGSEQYHIIVMGEAALPVKPSSLISSASFVSRDSLHRCGTTVYCRTAQISPSEFF